jgi:K+-transporting ATPase ATPase A chain
VSESLRILVVDDEAQIGRVLRRGLSAVSTGIGTSQLNNAGPHGLSEMLYAFTSGTGNNGSAFAGISTNTCWYNTTIGSAMLLGRFFMIIPMLALAGSLGRRKIIPPLNWAQSSSG